MSQPASPSVMAQPRDVSSAASSLLSEEELRDYLEQPSQSLLGKKRGLNGRLAHQFDNGKALRKGLSQSNAPALELTAMYDKLIRTRRKRVLQGMEPPSAGTRPTSAPISKHVGPEIRSSTAAPRGEFTFLPPKQPVLPDRAENMPTAGPSNQRVENEIVHVVKAVYAAHGLNTFLSDEDAWALWTNLSDGERAQLLEHYQRTCVDPRSGAPELGAQVEDTPEVQPLDSQPPERELDSQHRPLQSSSEAILHPDQVIPPDGLLPFASGAPITGPPNELTQEEIINAIKVVHARHHNSSTFMRLAQSNEHAWALWIKWDIGQRKELFTCYQGICAESQSVSEMNAQNGDQQAIHPVEQHGPHAYGQHQAHDPPHGAAHVPMTVEMRPPSPARHFAPEHNPPPEDRPPTLIHREVPLSQPQFEHGEQPQPPPPTALQAHSGPPPHLPPEHNPPPQHHLPGTGYQAGPPPLQQVIDSQRPSRPPTVVPVRLPADGHAPYGVGYPALRPPQQQFENGQVRYQPHGALRPPYPSQEWGLQGADKRQLANGSWTIQQLPFTQAQPPHQLPATVGYPPQPPPHQSGYLPQPPSLHRQFTDGGTLVSAHPGGRQYAQDGAAAPPQYGGQFFTGQLPRPAAQPQLSPAHLPHLTQAGGPIIQQPHVHFYPAQVLPQSQPQFQHMSQDRHGLPPVGASAPTHMHHPVPSRPGPPPAYLTDRTTSSQTTRTDDADRMTEETMTQGTGAFDEIEMWGSFAGTKDFCPRLDKGKGRATDAVVNNFHQEGPGDFPMLELDAHRPPPPSMEDTNLRLNQRPQRIDVPQFVNSDGTLLVINQLQGLTNAVHASAQTQKEFSKELKLFREMLRRGTHVDESNSSAGVSQKRKAQSRTAQQRKLDDNSPRARKREKRVNEKVQRLRGKSKYDGDEAGDEADDEDDGAADRDQLEEEAHFRRLRARVRHSLTSFLGIYDWSTVAHQYPTLTGQQLQDYKQRKESIVPTVLKNFRPDFHLPWKRHAFNKENRDVFIDKFLARVAGGAYFKHPTPKDMLTRECVGFVLDNHMRYCRDRWRRSLSPLSPERVAELAKGAAQRSRRRTLRESREVLVARRGYTKHSLLLRLLEPCNMSGDETDGDEKTVDSNYRIIVSRWQSQELRNFFWSVDSYYREDWAHPPHRRAMGGNRPRQRVLREGYSEDGIAPAGLWRNCYDKDWLEEQPAYIVRELKIVDEDYDFSFMTAVPQASAA